MKYIYILLLVAAICISKSGKSQTVRFDTCQLANQFNGEWMYSNGNDTIRIYLRAQRNFYSESHSFDDRIFGWHEFKQGNVIVESIYSNRFMQLTPTVVDTITKDSFSIWLKMGNGVDCNSNPLKAFGALTDYLQAKETKQVTATLNSSGTEMTWRQTHSEGYGVFTGATGMTLPSEFILIRQ
jgi:hypothetical protein